MRFLALILMITTLALADTKKAVFALTTSKIEILEDRFLGGVKKSILYYQDRDVVLDSIVVIHGGAYKFFVKDLSKTSIDITETMNIDSEDLHKKILDFKNRYNVSLRICSVGMKRNGIEKDNLIDGVTVIDSAMIELIDLQNSGYAYILVE